MLQKRSKNESYSIVREDDSNEDEEGDEELDQ